MPYPRYREPCGWQSLLIQRCPEPALDEETEYDVAVVGAGYTGLAAARAWAEARPDDRVAVLDASIVGEGSPGRHSGFLLDFALTDDGDAAAAARMAPGNALIRETMEELRRLVRRQGIRCQLARTGTYLGAATERGARRLKRYRRYLDAAGLECRRLDGNELEQRTGSPYYRCGLYTPDCTLVQPAALIRGLADNLPLNVRLYEETPALSMAREPGGWRLECPNGSVLTPTVVLANNAFARELTAGDGTLRARLAVVYTYVGLTEPLDRESLARLGSEAGWGLLPVHRLGTTLRRTLDGRLMVRAYHGYEREEDNDRVAERLAGCVRRRFPGLALDPRRPFAHVWGGAAGFTRNGAPVWGEVAPGAWVSAGCNGGGVVQGTLLGRLLARRALGETGPSVAQLFGTASRLPPAPLRHLDFAVRSSVERRMAGLET